MLAEDDVVANWLAFSEKRILANSRALSLLNATYGFTIAIVDEPLTLGETARSPIVRFA